MIDLLAQDGLRPFLISAFLVVGLLGLEIILMMLGLSVGPKADMPEIEAGDFEADFSGMEAADIAVEMDIDPGIAAISRPKSRPRAVTSDLTRISHKQNRPAVLLPLAPCLT